MTETRPQLWIVAGPNGVGKTTYAFRYIRAVSGSTSFVNLDEIVVATATLLAEGKLIGWAQGRAEFGPRALGNRSILADPRPADAKDLLNAKVKYREAFRPFAPSILA